MMSGMHEALERIADGHEATGMANLLLALRHAERAEPGAGLAALTHFFTHYPRYRTALRGLLCRLLSDDTATGLYAETGILANTGFLTELGRRMVGKVLPAPRDETLRGLFGTLFDRGEDVDWLSAAPATDWQALINVCGFADDEPARWHGAWQALADALDILSVRVAAVGVEPELLRHYRVPRTHNNPYLAQNAEMQRWLDSLRGIHGDAVDVPDVRQLTMLLGQCAEVGDRVRRAAHRAGASFALTFSLRRLAQMLARMHTLIALLVARNDGSPSTTDARVSFAVELVQAEANSHGMRDHLRSGTDLIALQVTEHASRTGEHYITTTRREYVTMFRAALGAGGIIGVMALIKTLLGGLHLPLLIEALAFSLNYALGFLLIYVLHYTIATKQPAMTAQTIAAQLSSGRRADVDAVALLVARVSRTQFVAVLGNVALAMPIAFTATWLAVAGGADAPIAKVPVLIRDLHPLASLAIFHAAIAGVWLFCTGLVSGYFDNLAAYERIGDRVRAMRWLKIFGDARRARLANWLQEHLGGVAGNLFLGFALGMTGFVGIILGLPLDIRHVTFAAANLAIAWAGSEYALSAAVIGIALIGIALIALTNVAVSFALALWVAFHARGEDFSSLPALAAALWRHFRRAPLSFFLPPRREGS